MLKVVLFNNIFYKKFYHNYINEEIDSRVALIIYIFPMHLIIGSLNPLGLNIKIYNPWLGIMVKKTTDITFKVFIKESFLLNFVKLIISDC